MDVTSLSLHELLTACIDRNNCEAWEEFIRRFHRGIAGVVYRKAKSCGLAEMTEDLVQEVFLALCRCDRNTLRDFLAGGEDKFFGLVRAIAINTVRDYARKVLTIKRGNGEQPVSFSDLGPQVASSATEEENLLKKLELERVDGILRASESPEAETERLIFWLYHRRGYTVKALASMPDINRSINQIDAILKRLKRVLNIDRARSASEGNK